MYARSYRGSSDVFLLLESRHLAYCFSHVGAPSGVSITTPYKYSHSSQSLEPLWSLQIINRDKSARTVTITCDGEDQIGIWNRNVWRS